MPMKLLLNISSSSVSFLLTLNYLSLVVRNGMELSTIFPISLKSSFHNYFGETVNFAVISISQTMLDFLKIAWTKH